MTSYNRALEITRCESIETTFSHENNFVCGDAHPNERQAVVKANRVRKPLGCNAAEMMA